MKYLNLTEGYNPNNAKEEDLIKFESFIFSGGEPHIKLDMESLSDYDNEVTISIRLDSMDSIGLLMVGIEALSQTGYIKYYFLRIPYFFGARQDRRMVEGEPLTVKIFAELINNMEFDEVTITDPHSDVTSALLNNVNVIDNHNFVYNIISENNIKNFNLISPDAGSNKKAKDLAKHLWGYDSSIELVKCDKTRDISTGDITGFDVYTEDLGGKPCIIVDDICSNGGTFLGLAEKLIEKNAGDLTLIITHGEFGKDRLKTLANLQTIFRHVYYSDSFSEVEDDSGFSKQVKFK